MIFILIKMGIKMKDTFLKIQTNGSLTPKAFHENIKLIKVKFMSF